MNSKAAFRLTASSATCVIGALAVFAVLKPIEVPERSMGAGPAAPPANQPDVMELTGIIRDFRERTVTGGHPDFERKPTAGFGLFTGNIQRTLDDDGKPVFAGGGHKVVTQAANAAGLPIAPHLANAHYASGSASLVADTALQDKAAVFGAADSGGIASADSFSQWFRDVPGVNLSMPLTIKLVKQSDGSYVFDDKTDPHYDDLGGFFPIENLLWGNPGGSPNRNFHFTFELVAEFQYDADAGQVFRYDGDDDVFVFVDGKLALDIGGVHGAVSQYVDFQRLGLTDGETYTLHFFFAERHRTQSNFRMVTNIPLKTSAPPPATMAYD